MSYCRFAWNGSDVYVYEGEGGIVCCGCRFAKEGEPWFRTHNPEEMIVHLAEHRRANHFVPEDAVLALWEDVPGAQRPSRPEPPGLERSRLMLDVAQMQNRIEELEKPGES